MTTTDRRIFYGPHPCEACGSLIAKASRADGGEAFEYPSPPIYPNTAWMPHCCSVSASATPSGSDTAAVRPGAEPVLSRVVPSGGDSGQPPAAEADVLARLRQFRADYFATAPQGIPQLAADAMIVVIDLEAALARVTAERETERLNYATTLVDEERRRWYRALEAVGLQSLEGLAPEMVAKLVRQLRADTLEQARPQPREA